MFKKSVFLCKNDKNNKEKSVFKSKYLFLAIGFFLIFIISKSAYDQLNKKTVAKSMRLDCQKELTTFEKIYKYDEVKIAKDLLKSGNIVINSSVEKAKYSKSRLFDYVKLEDMDKITKSILKTYEQKSKIKDKKLNIVYYIYENDVLDPGKKTEQSKLYAGYVVFKFIISGELIYQVQTDFMDKKGLDIPKSIRCAIKSFMTIQ